MSKDEVIELCGTAVGAPSALVGGWVQLGDKQPRRMVAGELRVRTKEGLEVRVTGAGSATFAPVAKPSGSWGSLEGEPWAALCIADAPAPDQEVEPKLALIRGGQRVALFGVVTRRAFAADTGGGPGAGASAGAGAGYRDAARAEVAEVAAEFIAVGDDCVVELARLREQASKATRRAESEAVLRDRARAQKPIAVPKGPHQDRLARNVGLQIMLGLLVIAGALALAMPTSARFGVLAAAAIALTLPAVLDALLMPRFREAGTAATSMEALGTAYFISAILAAAGLVAAANNLSSGKASERDRARSIERVCLFGGLFAVGMAGVCVASGRRRRRLLGLMMDAPAHAVPPVDGVWGRVDGRVGKATTRSVGGVQAVFASGVSRHWWGTATKDSAGIKQRNLSEEPFQHATPELQIDVGSGGESVKVRAAGAQWSSTVHVNQPSGTDRAEVGDVVASDCALRVVARAQGGVLGKTGADSLLVFGVAPGQEVGAVLRRLRLRERLGLALAALGTAGLLVQLVRSLL